MFFFFSGVLSLAAAAARSLHSMGARGADDLLMLSENCPDKSPSDINTCITHIIMQEC